MVSLITCYDSLRSSSQVTKTFWEDEWLYYRILDGITLPLALSAAEMRHRDASAEPSAGWKVGNQGSRRWQLLGEQLHVRWCKGHSSDKKPPFKRVILGLPVSAHRPCKHCMGTNSRRKHQNTPFPSVHLTVAGISGFACTVENTATSSLLSVYLIIDH